MKRETTPKILNVQYMDAQIHRQIEIHIMIETEVSTDT